MRNKARISRLRVCRSSAPERAEAVSDVLFGSQVREERQVLMHVPNVALPGCDVPLLLRVVKIFTAHRNAPVVRIAQSGNAIEQRGFSRARSSKENRESGQRAEVNIQVEAAFGIRKAFADARLRDRKRLDASMIAMRLAVRFVVLD